MSDEAAFLDALAANPADDTARLVYADWLDEHGDPAKAEYLRFVVALARAETDYARDQPDVARTLALAETLPADWRTAAGSRFMLVFYSHGDPAQKVAAIKTIRSVTGRGLAEAKAMSEQPPSKLLVCVPFEVAANGSEQFSKIPNIVVRIHPSDVTELPFEGRYTIVATLSLWDTESGGEPVLGTGVPQFAHFLQSAAGVPADAARELAAKMDRVTLAENLHAEAAQTRVAALEQFRPLHDDQEGW